MSEPPAPCAPPDDSGRAWLFTYGILREAATLQACLGHVPPGGVPAEVRGYARYTSAAGYYYLVPDAAHSAVPGVLWQVTESELRLLDRVEDCDPADPTSPAGEYRRVRDRAYTGGSLVECWLYAAGTLAADASPARGGE